ncbi:MAG: acetate--CoA ligase family protein [Candidatus Pacebacteria bacterium]|nr:acetate--CoA ligase family protein [Candidatus Paceibacterota bacterium]
MKLLGFEETKKILEKNNIPFVKSKICETEKQAVVFAREIDYPVVLKISSPDIVHKTDVKGIKVGIENQRDLKRAFNDILFSVKNLQPNAKINGILVQKMVFGKEVIIGMKKDVNFGPVLMFGLGGIFVEAIKDISLRVAPIEKTEVGKMIKEIKGFPVLKGLRGQKSVNMEGLAKIIYNLSNLCLKEENIQEIDFNPVIVNEKRALVVDARFLV